MIFFKCKHPADRLTVYKDATEEPIDQNFINITYHLYCRKCSAPVTIKYGHMIGGVSAFLKRGQSAP